MVARTGTWPEPAFGLPVAVLIGRSSRETLHLGLAYVLPGKPVRHLHLAWHERLVEDWSLAGRWAIPAALPERLALVAGRCRLIAANHAAGLPVRYGIAWSGVAFDDAGRFAPPGGNFGRTCATFVLDVFRLEGCELILAESWPRRNREEQQLVAIAEAIGPPIVAETMRREFAAGAARIMAHEVFGACLANTVPVPFELAAHLGTSATADL